MQSLNELPNPEKPERCIQTSKSNIRPPIAGNRGNQQSRGSNNPKSAAYEASQYFTRKRTSREGNDSTTVSGGNEFTEKPTTASEDRTNIGRQHESQEGGFGFSSPYAFSNVRTRPLVANRIIQKADMSILGLPDNTKGTHKRETQMRCSSGISQNLRNENDVSRFSRLSLESCGRLSIEGGIKSDHNNLKPLLSAENRNPWEHYDMYQEQHIAKNSKHLTKRSKRKKTAGNKTETMYDNVYMKEAVLALIVSQSSNNPVKLKSKR